MSSAPAWADQTEDNKKIADALFVEGRGLLDKKEYKAACDKFHAAQEREKQNVAILLNLGLCYEKQDRVATALKWYRKTQTAASENKDPAIKEYEDAAKERTADLAGKVSKVTFSFAAGFQPDGSEMLIDNTPIDRQELIVEVDRGPHVIEARAPGKTPSRKELIVEDNAKSLTYVFEPLADASLGASPAVRKRRILGSVIGGVVIAGGFTVSGFVGNKAEKDSMDPDQVDEKHSLLTANLIWIGGVAVGVGIAAYFWFTSPKAESSRSARITPVVSPESTGVAVFGRF